MGTAQVLLVVVVPEVCACATGNNVTANEREIISRFFKTYFPPVFLPSGTPLDSRYEQWNCESNLYRVTIALLLPYAKSFFPPELCSQP